MKNAFEIHSTNQNGIKWLAVELKDSGINFKMSKGRTRLTVAEDNYLDRGRILDLAEMMHAHAPA